MRLILQKKFALIQQIRFHGVDHISKYAPIQALMLFFDKKISHIYQQVRGFNQLYV